MIEIKTMLHLQVEFYGEEIIPMNFQSIPVNCALMKDITCQITENSDVKVGTEVINT